MRRLIGLFAIGVLVLALPGCHYNQFVGLEEDVKESWSQVENVYQRRADLIPNLVATVRGYASHEERTLTAVIEARAQATQPNIQIDESNLANLNQENIARFQQAQDGLSQALGRLMMVIERYPELKADARFAELQNSLERTENRITIERRNFNRHVRGYNTAIRSFPGIVTAKIFGFEEHGYFEMSEGADRAPVVEFE